MTTPKKDPHAEAAAAVRATVARAVSSLVSDLEKAGRAQLKVPALKVEARGQLETARAIRDTAKRTGWV